MDVAASMRHVLVHYNEIALKGRNRGFFEEKLVGSLRRALSGLGFQRVKRLYGRLMVEFRGDVPWLEVERRLSRTFGISHFERAVRAELDLESIQARLAEALSAVPPGAVASFAIVSRRSNKSFPLDSMGLNRALGRFVQERTGWKVSIDAPDLPIYVYILQDEAFLAFHRSPGPGGLPQGAAGKVACLISGGIDSPVAAHRVLRRGCEAVYVHFHSFPHTSAASLDKARRMVAALQLFRGPARLHLVPLADLQGRIVASCPSSYRVLLYRRFMLRAAEAIARREGALALVTGESLGQVASQTLENLVAIEKVATMPVLRPLIGFDKLEIVREAEAIGTFPISIEPHDDCCSLLMPRHPSTRARVESLEDAERDFDAAAEVEALLAAAEVVEIGLPPPRRGASPAPVPAAAQPAPASPHPEG